jgi:hypothetical protein
MVIGFDLRVFTIMFEHFFVKHSRTLEFMRKNKNYQNDYSSFSKTHD